MRCTFIPCTVSHLMEIHWKPGIWYIITMARQSKSERCDWFFLLSGFCHTDRFRGNGRKPCIFLFYESRQIKKLQLKRVPL